MGNRLTRRLNKYLLFYLLTGSIKTSLVTFLKMFDTSLFTTSKDYLINIDRLSLILILTSIFSVTADYRQRIDLSYFSLLSTVLYL